jgi:hypothetical protein
MLPLGLTFKKEGKDKYGQRRQGEIMLIHYCQKCREFSINRLAADDDSTSVLKIFNQSLLLEKEVLDSIANEGIVLLTAKDRPEIQTQLFGKTTS